MVLFPFIALVAAIALGVIFARVLWAVLPLVILFLAIALGAPRLGIDEDVAAWAFIVLALLSVIFRHYRRRR